MSSQLNTTQLLRDVRDGSRTAFDDLYAHVYEDLRRAAHQRLGRYRSGQTLNTTALVHEAYLRLVDQSEMQWEDRAHFLALASRAMRFILIDHVRSRTAQKRGGADEAVPLEAVQVAVEEQSADLLALNEALEALAAHSSRLAQLVEYRFFGGLTYEEIAEVTGMSVPTVKRDWARARAWLFRAMNEEEAEALPPPTAV
ncbi:MAG TPA: sigma-70 family RNA polymerase sigma factor [Longimicrobiaceae bacterium]